MTDELSRRAAIKLGAATAGVGAMGGLAGCSSIPFIGGGGGYTNWLAEPGVVADDDAYRFSWTDAQQVRNNEDEFDEDVYDSYESFNEERLDQAGLDYDDVNTFLSFQTVTVVDASFDRDDVADELEDNDYEDDTDHEGYTIYLGDNEFRAVGVSGSDLIYGRRNSDNDAVEVVEAAIDTNNGDEDRYVDENDDFAELTSNLGTGTFTSGGTIDNDSDQVASGRTLSVNGEISSVEAISVFDEADDLDQDDVDDLQEEGEDSNDVDNFSATKTGRVLTVSYDVDTDEIGTGEFGGFVGF